MPFRVRAFGEELGFGVSPGGFVQANWSVNQALVEEVAALSTLYEGKTALDLYAGAGNFTLPLALRASSVVAVEGYPPAARDAAANASARGLGNLEVLPLPVAAGLDRLRARCLRPEFALLDPPREGAAEAVAPLAALGPGYVLYVSCSPPTLVRDLKLFHAEGYGIEWIRAADMFPQTAHLESLVLLRRSSPRP
jgi:23S rRNA (uracil1939-C5)-methyltransferase